MCQFRILSIFRNYHSVRPEVCTGLRQIVTHIFIFSHDIGRISGIDKSQCLTSLCHIIDDFIRNDFRFHGLYTLYKPVIGFFQFLFIFRIHGISQSLQSHHKAVSLRIIQINISLILLIQKNFKTLFFQICQIYFCFIVYDTGSSPEIRNGILISRIIGKIQNRLAQIIQAIQSGIIQLLQVTFIDQPLNHIITGDQDIIRFSVCHFDIHLFIGIKDFHNYSTTGFFFKIADDILTGVFAPVIYMQGLSLVFAGRFTTAQTRENQDCYKSNCSHCQRNHFFTSADLLFILTF